MPNWCDNEIRVYGSSPDTARFLSALMADAIRAAREDGHADDPISILETFLPMPNEYADDPSAAYTWAMDNWGVKWPDYGKFFHVEDGYLIIRNSTAWGPALEGYTVVSTQWQTLTFIVTWVEPNLGLLGAARIHAGEIDIRELDPLAFPNDPETDGDTFDVDYDDYMGEIDNLVNQYRESVTHS